MKEVKIERTIQERRYEAIDGTQFVSSDECKKYEESARGVLGARCKEMVLKETNEWELFHCGCEDTIIFIIKIQSQAQADALMQLWLLDNPWAVKDDSPNVIKHKERAFNAIDSAYKNGDYLLIAENCDGEISIVDAWQDIVSRMTLVESKEE